MSTLIYFYDPMCSWCYGFSSTLDSIVSQLPDDVEVRYQLGGLAPDASEPMADEMREKLSATWHRIEQTCGVDFDHRYWDQQPNPPRSTFVAGRAIVALREQGGDELAFLKRIQKAYFTEAQNVWRAGVLAELAAELGHNIADRINANEVRQWHEEEVGETYAVGVQGYPTLALATRDQLLGLPIAYGDPNPVLKAIADNLP